MAKAINSKIENNILTITVDGKEAIVIDPAKLNPEITLHAILHGCKQKIVDAAALPSGATLTEKYNAMREVFERIVSPDGTWNKQAEGGTGAVTGLLYKALCRMYPGKAPDAIKAYHDKLDKSQQAALRKNPKVAAIIEDIKAESVKTAGINSNDLLAGLDDI